MKREIYFAYGYGQNKKYVCGNQSRVKDSHWLLKWLPPYVENKTKSPMPVVIEWIYGCAGGFDNGSAAISI